MTDDGPLAVAFHLPRHEDRYEDGGRFIAREFKAAVVSVLWRGQARRISVSLARAHQFADELEA